MEGIPLSATGGGARWETSKTLHGGKKKSEASVSDKYVR